MADCRTRYDACFVPLKNSLSSVKTLSFAPNYFVAGSFRYKPSSGSLHQGSGRTKNNVRSTSTRLDLGDTDSQGLHRRHQAQVGGPLSRELRALPLVALLIDGVHFARACGPGNSGVDDRAPNRSWDCAKSRPTTPRRCWSSRRIGGTRFRSREFASDRNENLFGRVCRIGRRVSHCRSGTMPLDRSGCWKQSAVPQGDLALRDAGFDRRAACPGYQ